VPWKARQYRRPGGPWDTPHLDTLLGAGGGEVVDGEVRLSGPALEDLVARVAGGLARRGARPGRPVTWQLPNSLAGLVLYRACWRLGAVAAPVLHSSGPTERAAALAQLEPVLQVDLRPEQASDPAGLAEVLGGPAVPSPATPRAGSEVAVTLFTSGSTGTPKAVLHTHRSLSWKARLMAGVHGLGPSDAVLMPAPLAHVSGLLNGVLLPQAAGMRSVLMRRFDPERGLALLAEEQVSFLAGPPTFFIAMAALLEPGGSDPRVASVRVISSGGAAVTPAFVADAAAAYHCQVKRTYGSTEAPTLTTSGPDDPPERARETDGRPVGLVELRITDPETGRRRPAGQPGELWVRGPELFCGYVDPVATADTTAPGGWFRTGDLAVVEDGGWLRIVGRLKDVIIRGGENISASEVEGALEAHPAVRQAVAVGYPDPLMGERVAAVVVGPGPFDLEECRRWFESRGLAKFKTPERVLVLDALPLLGSGKPDRAALRRRVAGEGPA
jgi:cyclohexanecarboxylate-CoA ligase